MVFMVNMRETPASIADALREAYTPAGMVNPAPVEEEEDFARFDLHYTCPDCGEQWEDQWSCGVDDDCPACGCRHVSPDEQTDNPYAETFVRAAEAAGWVKVQGGVLPNGMACSSGWSSRWDYPPKYENALAVCQGEGLYPEGEA